MQCIKELRQKAHLTKETGLVPTLDASASVVKSDTIVGEELQKELIHAFGRLKADQADAPDWHPGTDEMVQDLVHPSMYPLVWGRSGIVRKPLVQVDDAIEKWLGKGEVWEPRLHPNPHLSQYRDDTWFWSKTYQWLPSNVAFQDDGSVKFTSYINNLHPGRYPEIYRIVEKLIEKALPAWDYCLAQCDGTQSYSDGFERSEPRFSKPENPE